MEHFCDLRIDADLYLGNNVLMAKLRVLDYYYYYYLKFFIHGSLSTYLCQYR